MVVCNYLELDTSWAMATRKSTFGDKGTFYIMDDVHCEGSEKKLEYCSNKYFHDCRAGEGAGVICFGKECKR